MTTPPLVSPGVEEAVDAFVIELDEFVGDDARCETPKCQASAAHVITHHARHSRRACQPCKDKKLREAFECDMGARPLTCAPCGVDHIGVRDLTARPI